METQEQVKVKGKFLVELFGEDGKRKELRIVENVVVTVGKNYLATWLAAASQAGAFMSFIALGTGTNAASASDTALQTELATRVAGAETASGNVWQNVASFGPGVDTGAITESGIFSASSAGTMLARQTFAVINKAAGDTLQITWQVTFS